MDNMTNSTDFLFYSGRDGNVKIQVIVDPQSETVWLTQKSLAEIFNVSRVTITEHLQNIFKSGELQEDRVCRKIRHTAKDGKNYLTNFYNLDVIISTGYRVNSQEATRFRIWASGILKDYLIKGFAMNDDRLKQGANLFGKDYFDELLERIREIRASERRFYQKITDIYASCSIDYDKKSKVTQDFFAMVQNKLEFAITNHTAPEIIKLRANSKKPNMGLTSWRDEKNQGKILKGDVSVAKNYLTEKEINELNRIVTMYLDFAENMAARHKKMTMAGWVKRLDAFLQFNEYDILKDAGKVSTKVAKSLAEKEYKKFRVIQDREYISDFDKVAEIVRNTGEIPKKSEKEDLSNFNKSLKTALNYNPKENNNE